VPKNRISHSRKNNKNHHLLLKPILNIHDCPNCKSAVILGHVCKCGWYKDKPFTFGAIKLKALRDRKKQAQINTAAQAE